ncbi:MAG: ATP-binding protein [SAR202 cluster bacterium]|nr:ATP-binding protein [SAR202 cluster bacterium]
MTFSRYQITEPRVLDLNLVILEAGRMLRRLISEDIELVTFLDSGEPSVKADPGQIEQILVNMAVNARDAMPDGGRLVIETQAITLDDAFARVHAEASPGEYVMLSFADTGVGMTDDVRARIFEPLFTTKEVGKGTGLGLSTCSGIVTQSNGHITVDPTPDEGTTFKIFLPRASQEGDTETLHDDFDYLPMGSETLMLVEDEGTV